ncbi:membrane protein [Salmonella enterica subsp. arizonae]|uniref:Membrane protein n=1 Tax=Salmonella enterica subsp. arizonae TaxID=59203 RepID=A0A379T8R3_SALER|nr:membrane protein [Salmonella enterica subsp. arizonae]
MDINTLITHYGYAALVIGSMAEGETVTLLGGVAAHQGLLKFPLVAAAVALGGMMGDQLLYLLGRCYGGKILRRFSRYHTKIRHAQKMIQRHPLSVCDRHAFYVRIPGGWPATDWRQPTAA